MEEEIVFKSKPSKYSLQMHHVVIAMILTFFIIFGIAVSQIIVIIFGLIFSILIFLIVRLLQPRVVYEFTVTPKGVRIKNLLIPWGKMDNYHWKGEAQHERLGVIARYDPINLYKFLDVAILRINLKHRWYYPFPAYFKVLDLGVKQEESNKNRLESLIKTYIPKPSLTRQIIGTSLWPVVLFGIAILLIMLFGYLFTQVISEL